MSWLSSLREGFRPIPDPVPEERATPVDRPAATGGSGRSEGGRLSIDSQFDLFGMPSVLVPPRNAEDRWHLLRLDEETLRRISPARLMELLADLSPDVSRALWDFLRLCNPGWEVAAVRPDGKTVDPSGQAAVDRFMDQLADMYGSADVVINRLFMSAFLRGTVAAELVFDLDGRSMADLATPDPISILYIRRPDPVRGHVNVPVQWQNRPPAGTELINGYVSLTRPTIRIVPIDPFPGSPYGRPMAAPALFANLFLLGMLHDLRRVIGQQGYPRLDASIDAAMFRASLPTNVANDAARWKEAIDSLIAEINTTYEGLEPDSLFTHMNYISLNRPVGALNHQSLGSLDAVIQALERLSVRGLKTMPFLMASNQSTTETQAVREWEMMTQSIRTIQHHVETLLGRLMTLGLQAQGIAAEAAFRFAELRASEEIRDATAAGMRIDNAFKEYSYGWKSQDYAAQSGSGVDKADVPAPRILPRGATETTEAAAAQLAPESAGGSQGGQEGRAVPLRVVGED